MQPINIEKDAFRKLERVLFKEIKIKSHQMFNEKTCIDDKLLPTYTYIYTYIYIHIYIYMYIYIHGIHICTVFQINFNI